MDAGKYRYLLWQLIAELDTGKFDGLSIDDVRLHARGGSISKFLRDEFKGADFSLLSADDWATIDADFSTMENAVDARRKFGVVNKGMCLLLAWTLQGVQQS